jgi:sugar lactone lactonase YvrE
MKRLGIALAAAAALFLAPLATNAATPTKPAVKYEPIISWAHLEWIFPEGVDPSSYKGVNGQEYWKGAMPAAFKIDGQGNYYLGVPRWAPGIPGTVNKIVMKDGKALLTPYPSWDMNKEGDAKALQSVLGFEIDENNVMWLLDQGHINGAPSIPGAQKLVAWDVNKNTLIASYPMPDEIASAKDSFLNDLVIDNKNGFIYIADSGIFSDPLHGGLIVFNMKTGQYRRVLDRHVSTQDVPAYWFSIRGKKIWKDGAMRTGADGIALSGDRQTLYWCPLTGRDLYCVNTKLLQDYATPLSAIADQVVDLGSKGTNTDGMAGDSKGRIWYTMLEGMGVGYYDPAGMTFNRYLWDDRMVWVDGITFDNKGYMYFNNDRLHELFGGELDWTKADNFNIWKAPVPDNAGGYAFTEVLGKK